MMIKAHLINKKYALDNKFPRENYRKEKFSRPIIKITQSRGNKNPVRVRASFKTREGLVIIKTSRRPWTTPKGPFATECGKVKKLKNMQVSKFQKVKF
jgi:hypothetical protein